MAHIILLLLHKQHLAGAVYTGPPSGTAGFHCRPHGDCCDCFIAVFLVYSPSPPPSPPPPILAKQTAAEWALGDVSHNKFSSAVRYLPIFVGVMSLSGGGGGEGGWWCLKCLTTLVVFSQGMVSVSSSGGGIGIGIGVCLCYLRGCPFSSNFFSSSLSFLLLLLSLSLLLFFNLFFLSLL